MAWPISFPIPPPASLGRSRRRAQHSNAMFLLDLVDARIGDCHQLFHGIAGTGILPEGTLDRALYAPGPSTHLSVSISTTCLVGNTYLGRVSTIDACSHRTIPL